MTLQECYIALSGDYADVIGRLRSEKLVQKFVLKFLEDGSYELLCRSLAEGNREEAFRAAHTIKGMCQNLGFTKLGKSSSDLTESLRSGDGNVSEILLQEVQKDYQITSEAILKYKESLT